MKAALYARVSTSNQDTARQLDDLRSYCNRRGFTVYKEYIDEGISGSKASRPALNELFKGARKRLFDCVVVTEFSRFGRSMKHLVTSLEEFRALKIDFISVGDSVDTTLPTGELIFGVLAALSQYERRIIQDRVKSGLRLAVKNGKKLGRPSKLVKADVFRLRSQGLSLREIANMLGVSKSAVHKTLVRAES